MTVSRRDVDVRPATACGDGAAHQLEGALAALFRTKVLRDVRVRLHTHLGETRDENDFCLQVYGSRPVDFLESVGWLAPDVWLAHGIWFTDAEVARATEEARFALAYVARVSRRTGLKLRQDLLPEHLVDPSARSLTRVLGGRPDLPSREGTAGNGDNGAERERS